MNIITGYVHVKETDFGIPKLVVKVYDYDKEAGDGGFDFSNKEKDKNPNSTLKVEKGRTMGSCFTDDHGKFILTSEDLQFQGNEARPNLVLIVFAPEDIQDADDPFPHSLPPEKRILYISTVPRNDVGAEEVFSIRLLQRQLDKYQIRSTPGPSHGESESVRLSNAVENAWSFRDNMKEKVNPRIKANYERVRGFKEKAKEKFKNFSAVPKSMREHPDYLANPQDLWAKQRNVIDKGLIRLEKYQPELELSLTDKELASLKGDSNDGEGVELEPSLTEKELESLKGDSKDGEGFNVDPSLLAAMIKEKMGGVDLIRVREVKPLLLSPEALLKKYALDDNDNKEVVVP